MYVHGAKDVRQAEIHTAEPLVPEPSAFEVELVIEKLKSHRSPGIDQIPAELIKAGGRTIRCAIHKLIISIWNKEELPEDFLVGNLRQRDHWGDPDVDGRIILRWIFRKWEGIVGTAWSWLKIGTGGGHL